jgi:hypothetical protein
MDPYENGRWHRHDAEPKTSETSAIKLEESVRRLEDFFRDTARSGDTALLKRFLQSIRATCIPPEIITRCEKAAAEGTVGA